MTPSFDGPCMHEVLFDDRFLDGSGVTTLDFSKALIDEGWHPMTMYFPLVVQCALADRADRDREPDSLDKLPSTPCARWPRTCKAGRTEKFHTAPVLAPRRRLDETAAARKPVLRWKPPAPRRAAE